MNSSIQLLLEDFLGLMREEGELDVFLPLLLSAMGHEIVFRAQKGPRQYGVDISTVGKDREDGRRKLFLWVVKCGNLSRDDWDTTKQSIRQSINDVGDTYLDTHIAPQHVQLPRKLVAVTNGDIAASLALTISSFFKRWTKEHDAEAITVNGSMLAAWAEEYLLDEHLLPADSRALLRRMLVNVNAPELSVAFGRDLIHGYVQSARRQGKSPGATRKRLLVGLRAVRTALSVLTRWAVREENMTAPYRLSEFAVLAVWADFHKDIAAGNRDVQQEFLALLQQWSEVAFQYHERLTPYYVTQNALASYLADSLLVASTAFTELGRLGLQAMYWGYVAGNSGTPETERAVEHYVGMIDALLSTHSCTGSAPFDHHAGDVHVAMLALAVASKHDLAKKWLETLAVRLAYAAKHPKYLPLAARFEDALSVRWGEADVAPEFINTSTLVPVLLTWAAALGMTEVYTFIRTDVLPAMAHTTLNFWSSDQGFDAVVADPMGLSEHGVGEGLPHPPEDPAEFLATMARPLDAVEPIEKAAWYQERVAFLPLLAGLHWRLQVPREMLVKHAMAMCGVTSADALARIEGVAATSAAPSGG